MLSDDQTRLVTAAVDGELTPAQDAAFRRLIGESVEALKLFQQLSAHSDRLKRLPRAMAPADFPLIVLGRVTPIVQVRTPIKPAARANWLPYATAAAALLAVSAGGFWYVTRPADRPEAPGFAQKSEKKAPAPKRLPTTPPVVEPREEPEPEPQPVVPPVVVAARLPEVAPTPRVYSPDLIGASALNAPPPLERAEVRLPFLAAVAELDRPDVQERLAEELGRDSAFRLDLFAPDMIHGAERFLAVARKIGMTVAVDAVAQERLKRKLPPAAWAIYTDSLTAEDVAALAIALAVADRATDKPAFGPVHLVPAKDADRRELRELLGVDPSPSKRPKAVAGPTVSKSVAAGTVDQLTATASKGKSEKTGLLLTHLPSNGRANPQMSKEIRDYLARRGDAKPSAVPLLVVIRSPGS